MMWSIILFLIMTSEGYTIIYVLFVPLFGILLDRVLRVWFVGARTGRSRAAWLGVAAAYAFYITSYDLILGSYMGTWLEGPLILAALLAVVGLLPLIVNPTRKSYSLIVTGFAWGVAGGLNYFGGVSAAFRGGYNYFIGPILDPLIQLRISLGPPCGMSSASSICY